MNASYNTMTVEDVINTLDPQYRLSAYLKLRGHIAYRAAKLAGQLITSVTKRIYDNRSEHGLEHLDTFNQVADWMRGEDIENELLTSAGMEAQQDMFKNLRELVLYANKLNYDMQDMVDEGGTKRIKPGFKVRGVAFTEGDVLDSWVNSVKLLADPKDDFDTETYAEYAAKIENADWRLTEAEWIAAQAQDDNIYKDREQDIVSLLMSFGLDEGTFDEMNPRSQIAAIENMRGKIGRCIDSALKSLRYNNTLDRAGKIAEASKLKGLITSWDGEFCKMLDSSRYANYGEFMYSHTPGRGEASVMNTPVGRRIIARAENRVVNDRVSDCTARSLNGEQVTAAEYAAEREAERVAKRNAERGHTKLRLDDLADILEMQDDDVN